MDERIAPARAVKGTVALPGDKSISHRYGMLAAIAEGDSIIRNFSTGADPQSTLGCMEALGARIERNGREATVHGVGLDGLRQPAARLDAGNSGSTIRMLSGILAAQPFVSEIAGDESLARRPMDRVMRPLREMGAEIEAREGRFPPLRIQGRPLRPIEYTLPVASAQVKTCVLFAGLYAEGTTVVHESVRTRDHTELALRELGAELKIRQGAISLTGRPRLQGRELVVPGDMSSAAFFIVAALLLPGSDLVITGVGLNPTRSALLDFLSSMGAQVKVLSIQQISGELIGDIQIRHAPVQGGRLSGATTAALIDEIPALAVLGAVTKDGLVVNDARELRVKETDRIATVVENLHRMGVRAEAREDGLTVPGGQRFQAAEVDSFGDHRIAMAFSVAALAGDGESVVHDAAAASVSYPEFYEALGEIAQ